MKKFLKFTLIMYCLAAFIALGWKVMFVEKSFGEEGAKSSKGGAELWTQNCARCHNMRSPSAYSDKQWEVITQHMRVRANLTAEETRKILEFLKSGN